MTFFEAFFDEMGKLGSTFHFQTRRDLSKDADPDHRDTVVRNDQSGEAPISWRERRAKQLHIKRKIRE